MLNCWCITWPVGVKRLIFLLFLVSSTPPSVTHLHPFYLAFRSLLDYRRLITSKTTLAVWLCVLLFFLSHAHNFHSSFDIIRVTKYKQIRWTGHANCTGRQHVTRINWKFNIKSTWKTKWQMERYIRKIKLQRNIMWGCEMDSAGSAYSCAAYATEYSHEPSDFVSDISSLFERLTASQGLCSLESAGLRFFL